MRTIALAIFGAVGASMAFAADTKAPAPAPAAQPQQQCVLPERIVVNLPRQEILLIDQMFTDQDTPRRATNQAKTDFENQVLAQCNKGK